LTRQAVKGCCIISAFIFSTGIYDKIIPDSNITAVGVKDCIILNVQIIVNYKRLGSYGRNGSAGITCISLYLSFVVCGGACKIQVPQWRCGVYISVSVSGHGYIYCAAGDIKIV